MMNNRYIFRGKRKDIGEWVYGFYVFQRKRSGKFGQVLSELDSNRHFIIDAQGKSNEVIPETVGQCTGRKYANDKLLFEGDIVKWYSDYDDTWGYSHTAEYCGVIVWNTNDCCWNIKVNNELIPFNDYDWDISMVVGNIHDNPELLEVER